MGGQRRMPEADDERRTQHEQHGAEPLHPPAGRDQLHEQRAEGALEREREHQPHADELERGRQPRAERLEHERRQGNRVGEADRPANRPHQVRRGTGRQRPRSGAIEVPAQKVHVEIAAHQPFDILRVDQRRTERGRHAHGADGRDGWRARSGRGVPTRRSMASSFTPRDSGPLRSSRSPGAD